jgi:UDP-glucose:(heptosyl)LPS alpha-1,3-glucosyltransferase
VSRIGWQFNRVRRRMAALERQVAASERTLCLPVSRMVAGELERYYGRTAGVRVVYNAVDVPHVPDAQRLAWRRAQRAKVGIGEGQTLFLTAARNLELKGVGELIAAFGAWHRQAASAKSGRLVVVGADGPGRYVRLAQKLGVGKAVGFVAAVGADKMFQWFCAADVCVLLSWYDPCSRVVLEATRWGVPSITTACNGAAEVLAEGAGDSAGLAAGIVVPSPADGDAIVQAMERLSQPAFRNECRQRCLKISPRLSIERHVDELLAAYEETTK